MKINSKILNIPPYISTSWDQVSSLQMEQTTGNLLVYLINGKSVSIPNLSANTIEEIFTAHSDFIEEKSSAHAFPGPLRIDLPEGQSLNDLGSFTGMMQHDPSQKDAPPLPQEILSKVKGVAKAMGLDLEAFNLPDASEPHCNCPYCQIAKALHGKESEEETPIQKDVDDEVNEEELQFREWDIEQVEDKLYNVSNPFNKTEHYQVYLGHPIGCTCGKNNCPHILAVLNS